MKNKNLHTAIAYWFLILGLVLFLSGCRSKKSTTDFKQTETENVSIIDNSTVAKTETVTENNLETKIETVSDKSFFEAWMSFESDKIIITDAAGNKTEITNPRINKKSSQTNDITKTEQTDSESNKVAANEEKQQNDVKVDTENATTTDLIQSYSSKGKEPVWLYVVGAVFALIIITAGYYILKRQFSVLLSKKK